MPKKYVVKTDSGSFYDVQDHRHLVSDDVWIILMMKKECKITGLDKSLDMKDVKIKDFIGKTIRFLFNDKPSATSPIKEVFEKI